MNPILRNILVVLGSVVAGGIVNMGIVMLGPMLIPPPEGVDVTTMEGLKASMHLLEPKHFLMPFLAHAIGTLVGASLAASFVTTRPMWFALGIGAWFLLGGVMNVFMLPSPMWFTIVDLGGAYLPMGYLGGRLAAIRRGTASTEEDTK